MRSVDPTDRVKPGIMTGLRARLIDEAPVRGFHQGQRSCRPHNRSDTCAQAIRPSTFNRFEESPCFSGAIHTCHYRRLVGPN